MFLSVCLFAIPSLPLVHAAGWDDFSNNLATDLAPFLSLFGEQITKQYLSESITLLDYFIFAMAPMGILTAVVSAIRVCGGPSLRAFIGRAQEGGGNAEAELCSSTSRDVCELYNNGGIVRVFGRPKILEIVHDPVNPNFDDRTAGIYTFQDYLSNRRGKDEWEEFSNKANKGKNAGDVEGVFDAFAPNLSLNIGIKRKPQGVFWTVAMAGLILQAGVLVFAVIVTYYLQWEKGGGRPESYACPLTICGTIIVCSGIFLCAFLVGQSTNEQVFRRREKGKTERSTPSSIYWVQPGGQVLGDQTFDAFSCSDCKDPLQEYITSSKKLSKTPELTVWVAVGTTISGFVLQFIGLRGIHSAVSIAQLGAIMVMSAARAALRMQRLKTDDNDFVDFPDEIIGHELDWLALRIGQEDIDRDLDRSGPVACSRSGPTPDPKPIPKPGSTPVSTTGPTKDSIHRYFWTFSGLPEPKNRIMLKLPSSPAGSSVAGPSAAAKLLGYRSRLAQLTQSPNTQVNSLASARNFEVGMVEVRREAEQLSLAIESVVNTIFSKATISKKWNDAENIWWGINCTVSSEMWINSASLEQKKKLEESGNQSILHLQLSRGDLQSPWMLQNKQDLEGLLGLWVWSLKSDPVVETLDSRNHLTISRAAEIPVRRIVSINKDIQMDMRIWLGGETCTFLETTLIPTSTSFDDPRAIWQENSFEKDCYSGPLPSWLPENLGPRAVRFFGWHAAESSQSQGSKAFRVWSAPANSTLPSLCAQEVFGCFITSILHIVDDIGSIEIQQERQHFRVENNLVSELVNVFTERQVGSREDALLSVLPPIIAQRKAPSTESVLEVAFKSARQHRRRSEWRQAEGVLRWAWNMCAKSQLSRSKTTGKGHSTPEEFAQELTKRVAISLGELYRWALAVVNSDLQTKTFAREGIKWLLGEKFGQPYPIIEAIDRYSAIADKFSDKREGCENITSAIKRGDLMATLVSLTRSTPAMTSREKGNSLFSAAEKGWTEVVFALLELGAEPDYKGLGSRTALSYAAQNGNVDAVKELMDWGAFPNSEDDKHRTPLSYASEVGHGSVIEILLRDPRVYLDSKDKDGRTPLSYTSEKGDAAIVRLLLEKGVEPDSKTTGGENGGRTPLSYAAEKGDATIVRLLLEKGVEPDSRTTGGKNGGRTPLSYATEKGDAAMVRLLLEKGVEPDSETIGGKNGGRTPLSYAAEKGDVAMVRLLLEKGVEPDLKTIGGKNGGRTPLSYAAEKGDTAIVGLLLEKGVEPDSKTTCQYSGGRTPLSYAAKKGGAAVVRLLLEKGAKPDFKATGWCNRGRTPLSYAAEKGDAAIVKLLLEKDVESDSKATGLDNSGRTPLSFAAEKGDAAIVKLLLEKGANPDSNITVVESSVRTPLSFAAEKGDAAVVKLLLEKGANPDSKVTMGESSGRTPLSFAAEKGDAAVVKLLLEKGADPDYKITIGNNRGRTPLSYAAEKGNAVVMELLQSG